MPVGVLLLLIDKHKVKFRLVLSLGIGIGCFIEATQFVLDNTVNGFLRYVDINDVISNALGVVLGYYALMIFFKIVNKIVK
ncbi:hypothetical protein WR164_03380 [Philodulcilactobacillus myokoensis]|uniref:VanZ-like domain-containing protein n=2 Tax=Philodulcilactobacillus myokoensis TaxID=2929573 RepID=A0A9W6ESP6_9LACO|nr:hypothetical protein WR164_03380 [Philodulcilactobacillus myokoensis]